MTLTQFSAIVSHIFIMAIVRSYITFVCMGGEVTPLGEKFFTVSIFRKNISKYTKLMVEPYICDILNHSYRFFSLLTKKILKLENCLEGIRLISFIHV